MKEKNSMTLTFPSLTQNEAFARMAVSAFIMPLDPTISEITDIKTAVSEAVTNAIIHGYEGANGDVKIFCTYNKDEIFIEITDFGKGIDDIEQAMAPLYTSKPELERSGLGFTVMETFMDRLEVISKLEDGTKVTMYKKLSGNS